MQDTLQSHLVSDEDFKEWKSWFLCPVIGKRRVPEYNTLRICSCCGASFVVKDKPRNQQPPVVTYPETGIYQSNWRDYGIFLGRNMTVEEVRAAMELPESTQSLVLNDNDLSLTICWFDA